MAKDAGGQQMIMNSGIMFCHFSLYVDIQQTLLFKTQVPFFDMLHLLIDDDGANDQRYRDDELCSDQPFANEANAAFTPDFQSFQHSDRIKGREIKGRITTR